MIVSAAVCPHPPLLIPEVAAGAAGELDELRAACGVSIAAGLAAGPERVVLVGAGASTTPWAPDAAGALPGFGLPGPAAVLPLSLTIGRFLLDSAGWTGPRELHTIAASAEPEDCVALGESLVAGSSSMLLVLGDASARRSAAAPGHLDERAEPFDGMVAGALAKVDTDTLLALDSQLAADLLVAGRPAWQVLAGAVRAAGGSWVGTLHADVAPYGVGYLVASWLRD